jgi:hypothetical protein
MRNGRFPAATPWTRVGIIVGSPLPPDPEIGACSSVE